MFKVQDVTGFDMAFGGNIKKLVPLYGEIPNEYKYGHTKWNRIVSDFFFSGAKNIKFKPKDGVDGNKAFAHIRAILASWDIKHEHKEAAAAYLMSEWFDDIQYEKGK